MRVYVKNYIMESFVFSSRNVVSRNVDRGSCNVDRVITILKDKK